MTTNTTAIGWDCNTCGQAVCLECFEEIGGGIECCPMPKDAQCMLDAWHIVTENTSSGICLECEKFRK
jgi:hypothetical protein